MIYKSTTIYGDWAAVRWRVRLGRVRLTLHARIFLRITRAGVTAPFWIDQRTGHAVRGLPR